MHFKNKDGKTYFTLSAGTTFPLGSETITLVGSADFTIDKELSRDSIVETITASGNLRSNLDNVQHTEDRDGSRVKVTYGIRGNRIETEAESKTVKEPTKAKPKATKAVATKAKPKKEVIVRKSATSGKVVSKETEKSNIPQWKTSTDQQSQMNELTKASDTTYKQKVKK